MRTELTEAHYSERAKKLISRAEREIEVAVGDEDPVEVAEWLIKTKQDFKKATFRLYRSAIIYEFAQRIQAGAKQSSSFAEAIARLKACSPPVSQSTNVQTSAQKLKKLPDSDLEKLMTYFQGHPSRHGIATLVWLFSGIRTGLRPCEWFSAELNADYQLLVENAKSTNGRSHGKTRIIDLSGLDASGLEIVRHHIDNVDKAKNTLDMDSHEAFKRFYDCCRACLYEATRAIWLNRKKHISLYSARHQFAANAKFADLSLAEIAALMGHASIKTATEHYGRRLSGKGGFTIKASDDDVERVQQLNLHRDNTVRWSARISMQ